MANCQILLAKLSVIFQYYIRMGCQENALWKNDAREYIFQWQKSTTMFSSSPIKNDKL